MPSSHFSDCGFFFPLQQSFVLLSRKCAICASWEFETPCKTNTFGANIVVVYSLSEFRPSGTQSLMWCVCVIATVHNTSPNVYNPFGGGSHIDDRKRNRSKRIEKFLVRFPIPKLPLFFFFSPLPFFYSFHSILFDWMTISTHTSPVQSLTEFFSSFICRLLIVCVVPIGF